MQTRVRMIETNPGHSTFFPPLYQKLSRKELLAKVLIRVLFVNEAGQVYFTGSGIINY